MRYIVVFLAIMLFVFPASAQKLKKKKMVKTESGLQVMLLQRSNGEQPKKGDKVIVHYTGRLQDSTVFDSSVDRGKPFEFVLGQGQVIPGWDEGIGMLKAGEKARFVIPPDLGYGSRAMGSIPANSTLIFDVELLDVIKGATMEVLKNKDTITTASGLQYIIISKGAGKKVQTGMKVKVHYSGFFSNGDKFDSSVDRGQPIEITLGMRQVIPGWEEGLALLNVGDKARLIIPYQLAYGEAGRPPVIPPKSTLIFDLEMIDAVETVRPKPFDVAGLDTLVTASGLKYIMVKKTENVKAKAGDKVSVHYTGFFESGEIFDSSVERGQPLDFEVGKGMVIPGWDEGLMLLNKGEKARLIIPWQLGYGENGYGPIPPKATLIFDVELMDVK
jgi:peptidylprolyl isomerase